ncbi:Deoxyuridine 5'-triphosphate nucleotidohydrolase [compost metagenome]
MPVPSIGRTVLYNVHALHNITKEPTPVVIPAIILGVQDENTIDIHLVGIGENRVGIPFGTAEGHWCWPQIIPEPVAAPSKVRGFEVVADWAKRISDEELAANGIERKLPCRGTQQSAGYDFFVLQTQWIAPGHKVEFCTDIKAYMQGDEKLHFYPRSSAGIKLNLMLANTIPTIDADYYENEDNDGNITLVVRNLGTEPVCINAGDRIAQGIFEKYLAADNDPEDLPVRKGGIGHTGK